MADDEPKMRCVLDDTTLLGAYAKALGYDVPSRAERGAFNVARGLNPDGTDREDDADGR